MSEQQYPYLPGFKTGGASAQAAAKIAPKAVTIRQRVLNAFRSHGEMTADQCANLLKSSILSVRPRVTELARMGELIKSSDLVDGQFGAKQHLYKIKS